MSTPTHKPYPSDVSDEKWALVAPYLTLPEKMPPSGGMTSGTCSTPCAGSFALAPNGGCCPTTTCHRGPPSTSRPSVGARQGPLRRWSTICGNGCGWPRAAPRTPAPLFWTAAGAKRRNGAKVPIAVGPRGRLLARSVTAANKPDRNQVAVLAADVQELSGARVAIS